MSRRDRAQKRDIRPNPVYNDVIVAKFINEMMKDGKKSISEKLFYDAMAIIKSKMNREGIEVFREAIENVKPVIEVVSKRVGGANYQVPVQVRPERSQALGIKWLVKYSRLRKEYGMEKRLANELMEASRSEGGAVKKKEEIYRIAESNKAFSHYG